MNIHSVSTTLPLDPYTAEQQRLLRSQRIAEQLREQSNKDEPAGQMVSGYYVPTSPLNALAKGLKGFTAGMMDVRADQDRLKLGDRYTKDMVRVLREGAEATSGRPAKTE